MDTQKFKQLPYGNSNFESIITENYAYVDKTRFIELLEKEPNKNQFFIRPRKFGKSLFYSLLSHYYDVNRADSFERLFGELYIGQHPTPKRSSYLIMQFNFSGLNTSKEEGFIDDFNSKIKNSIFEFLLRYQNIIPNVDKLNEQLKETSTGSGRLDTVLSAINATGRKVFVLIDEYDHFANDLIAMGKYTGSEFYRTVVRANGVVRDFYETLKISTSGALGRIFITGISPVMLNDLTSGFNIANNLTLESAYNEMMGFTQEEVNDLMAKTGVDTALVRVDMEMYYNGYLFNRNGGNKVYNPSMILYFFDQLLRNGASEDIIDSNMKTDYGRLQQLVQNGMNRQRLLEITKNNGVISDIIKDFSIDRLEDDKYFISLLFYMGLLTVDTLVEGKLFLKIPNYSIRTVYWEYIEQLILDQNKDIMIDLTEQKEAVWQLAYRGNLAPYIDYVSRNIFCRLSNRDLEQFDEKYIKIMLLNGLFQSKLYVPVTEREVEGGYMDMYLQRSPLLPDIRYEWVWEIKYIKKGNEKNRKLRQAAKQEALVQLERYRQAACFAERDDVKYAAIIFIGKDKYEMHELT
ncbi:MAG: ATP-binding protein [Prevotellaceae bacterium]|jgi:hypothetical protein|nr:ATP-binding protein [Prevotellaceae bacterium]